ncbi:HNH endonuclease signature motif containing protein [Pseudonocardia xinjiangensis]|uniref:HNH endonuclease signature motif containing protein n=1 Tax=Pseudonocardia xinjiangensis TaxID=75289 RepID=UPI0031E07746
MFDIDTHRVVPPSAPLAWTEVAPDGMAVLILDQAGPPVDGFEALERIGAWEKVIAWAQARQYAEITQFVAAAETNPAAGLTAVQAVESAQAEVGMMLRLSPGGTAWRVGEARQLVEQFPATFAALQTGSITLPKARIIAEACTDLHPDAAAAVEQKVLARAPQQTTGQLRAALRRAVLRADSEAAARRRERKRRERAVVLYPERDGMATLSATLPAAEAVGVFAVLDQHARGCGSADERPMAARRADALVDLVLRDTGFCSTAAQQTAASSPSATTAQTGPEEGTATAARSAAPRSTTTGTASAGVGNADPGSAGRLLGTTEPDPTGPPAGIGPAAPGSDRLPGLAPPGGVPTVTNKVSIQIRVTVPLDTLRGVSDEPGELAGYGPIPADHARQLAADPDSIWHRLVTDPLSGALLDYGTTRYRPPPHLTEHVIARHQYCQGPGCRVPANRCDLDHNIPFDPLAGDGPTSAANLGPKCRPHHRLKGMPGWSVSQYPDGSIIWTTPSGHTYRVDPPPLTEPRTPTPVTADEPPPF